MEALLDGQTGDLLSQRQIDINNYDIQLIQPKQSGAFSQHCRQQRHGHFTRTVLLALAFDAVVSVGGGSQHLDCPKSGAVQLVSLWRGQEARSSLWTT